MTHLTAILLITLAGTSLASAQSLDDQIAAFIAAPGFDIYEPEPLEEVLAELWTVSDSISPGGNVGPLEKAMLLAERGIDSTRTRTAISYGELINAPEGAGAPVPFSFIEVRHYNLAPVIHAENVAAYGAGNVADIAEFGGGPHTAWRFVFMPVMGSSAALIDVSSRMISDEEAAEADCTGRLCLDTSASFDDRPDWDTIEGVVLTNWDASYPQQMDGIATPARAIAEIATFGYWANVEAGQYGWTGGEHPEAIRDSTPFRSIGIDRNLGQDASIDVVWEEGFLNDDSLSAIAFRRAQIGDDIYWMRASTPR